MEIRKYEYVTKTRFLTFVNLYKQKILNSEKIVKLNAFVFFVTENATFMTQN